MNLGLDGRSALVFGASRGLGRAVAEALAAEGASIVLVARESEALVRAARSVADTHGGVAHALSTDLTSPASVAAVVARAEALLGCGIDILVNNTGGPPPGGVSGVHPDVWSARFQEMVGSVFKITDDVLPGMRSRGWGRVLTIASTTVVEPNPNLGLSNTLRSALVGWSKTLAGEVAREGVTVNVLLPGRIATDRTMALDADAANRRGLTIAEVRTEAAEAIPVGRYGLPEEFGAVAAFLAGQPASYVTGSMIRVDGGALRSV